MFWSKKRKLCIPLHTPVLLYKSGVERGYSIHGHVILMQGLEQTKEGTYNYRMLLTAISMQINKEKSSAIHNACIDVVNNKLH